MKQYRFASKKGRHIGADSKRKKEKPHIDDNMQGKLASVSHIQLNWFFRIKKLLI